MAVWVDPVFDRTAEDVAFAKEQIQRWVQQPLVSNRIETYDLKGCLNLSDINRIEGNIQYLSDRLSKWYYKSSVSCKRWERSGLPTEKDVRRILSNLKQIIDSYCQMEGTPSVPSSMARYTDINAIEKNLYNIKQLLDAMEGSFLCSGTFQAGAARMLPIRR